MSQCLDLASIVRTQLEVILGCSAQHVGKEKDKALLKPAKGKGKGKVESKMGKGKGKVELKPAKGKGKGKDKGKVQAQAQKEWKEDQKQQHRLYTSTRVATSHLVFATIQDCAKPVLRGFHVQVNQYVYPATTRMVVVDPF